MPTRNAERFIFEEAVVEANVSDVWQAWTTKEGVLSFFASACNIDVRVDGPYEMLFNLDAEPGSQGGEGVKILAIQPQKMLSFTWNAPPTLPDVRQPAVLFGSNCRLANSQMRDWEIKRLKIELYR